MTSSPSSNALVAQRGAPGHLRMDNGPELIAWALRDWCRLHRHRRPTTSSRARRGRTPSSRASTAGPRRAAQHRGVRQPARSPGRRRSLARRVQHLPTPLLPRRPHPRRVRRALDHQPTSAPMTAGPLNGAPSARAGRGLAQCGHLCRGRTGRQGLRACRSASAPTRQVVAPHFAGGAAPSDPAEGDDTPPVL